ncbi:helix-turn-helix transcriptional regulator [Lacticaseibacillus pabuli]|uniref:Helix-turn-helix transcriptional regulator n=1 Tax=Lacticaseibacillus pabuli TaxID=3025672 RepID=A0ABY7WR73_9LACO|nr:helix-turn-helix transcriptional regulator [Lacticaseibacillus sp. KACC 23028]WDF82693.1 helix-turn-helix transcriptional regulator [Lacticaseibacillus sp. KACC 23028]
MESNFSELVGNSGLTLTELSKAAGVSRTILSQLNNSREIPGKTRFDALESIARVLNVPVSALFRHDGISVEAVEILPVIQNAEIPLTKRQQAVSALAGRVVQHAFGGFIQVTLANEASSIAFCYFVTDVGGMRIEPLTRMDLLTVWNKAFGKKLNFDTQKLNSVDEVLYKLSPESVNSILTAICKNSDFSAILSVVAQAEPDDMKDVGTALSYNVEIESNIPNNPARFAQQYNVLSMIQTVLEGDVTTFL